jgi:hypothetical protein
MLTRRAAIQCVQRTGLFGRASRRISLDVEGARAKEAVSKNPLLAAAIGVGSALVGYSVLCRTKSDATSDAPTSPTRAKDSRGYAREAPSDRADRDRGQRSWDDDERPIEHHDQRSIPLGSKMFSPHLSTLGQRLIHPAPLVERETMDSGEAPMYERLGHSAGDRDMFIPSHVRNRPNENEFIKMKVARDAVDAPAPGHIEVLKRS